MASHIVVILVTIVIYLLMMVVIGVVFSKKNNDVGDFYLGGRKLGPIVTAMSAEASDMSSYLLMGLPGLAYLCGTAEVGWTVIGLFVGTYLNWLFVAKRLRVYSAKIGAITIPDFFARRFRDKKIIMGVSALIILIFFIPYTGSGFAACGKLFESLFKVDYHVAMIVSAVVIILYTSLGGFLAASTTDLIQSIVMTIALIVLVCFGVHAAGGIDAVMDNAKDIPQYLSMTSTTNSGAGELSDFGFLPIVSTLAWGLGYFGMPHILLRFMAIDDKNKVKTSRRIASVWVIISMAIAVFIGIIGNALSKQGIISDLFASSSDSERVVISMADKMSQSGILAAVFAGLIFSGILACTMSTSDSQLLAASSSMSENLVGGVFGIKLDDKKKMLLARLVLVVIAVLGVVIAWDKNSSIFGVVSFAWAGFGATFGPLMLTSLFWKRTNKYGAIAGLIAGGVMVFVWHYGIAKLGGAFAIYELLPAFIVALIAIVLVSLLTGEPEEEIVKEFEEVKAGVND